MKNQAANNGTFIPKPGFTVVQNSVARDWNLSSGALGLYTRIQSYITMENITLTKGSLMERVPEGEYAFNTAWNELKSKGYLFIHVYPGEIEMEALALSTLAVLEKKSIAKEYTGEPVFTGFEAWKDALAKGG